MVFFFFVRSAYPPTYACHTSMTGTTAKPSSSTEDTSERPECPNMDGSFILGYDFQTTSTETTSDGIIFENKNCRWRHFNHCDKLSSKNCHIDVVYICHN